MKPSHILDSEIKIIDRTPLRIEEIASGVAGNFADIIGKGGKGGTSGTGGRGPAILIPGAGRGGEDEVAFDTMLDEVRPGDLITSDFMMRLLARINRLETAVRRATEGGDVGVPNFFGLTLAQTVAKVQKSDGLLKMGRVLDTAGQEVDPKTPGQRVVLGQHPAPSAEVDKGTALNLLVSFAVRGKETPAPGGGGTGGGSAGPGGIGGIGLIDIDDIEIIDNTRAVGGGSNVPGATGGRPPVAGPATPTPVALDVTAGLPGATAQPGAPSAPTQPTPVAGARPDVELERVTDEITQPSAGVATQPGTTVSVGGATNISIEGAADSVAGRVGDANVSGASNVGLNPDVAGAVGGANIRSEEAPKSASKGATKARRPTKK